jgi:hypothetical protein
MWCLYMAVAVATVHNPKRTAESDGFLTFASSMSI